MKSSFIKTVLLFSIAPSVFAQYGYGKFLDFETLRLFSDAEQVKLFRSATVGKCHLNELELVVESSMFINEEKIARRFKGYIKDNQKVMPDEKKRSDKVIAKSLRDVLDDGDCGEYSEKEIEKSYKDYPGILGRLEIGFEYFVGQGLNADEVAKHHYPLKKFLSKFSLGIGELKEAGYTLGEMYQEGISIQDILNEGYSLKVLLSDGVPMQVLKSSFKIGEFVAAGVGVWGLRNQLKYTVSEVKGAGFGIKELVDGGYNLLNEVKPLFSIMQFKAANYGVWSMRNHLAYSALEVKSAGFGIKDLVDGGFNLKNDLKSLFTIHEFKSANYGVWSLRSHLGYSASDVKSAGFGIKDLVDGGFNLKDEVKPLFSVRDFKNANYGVWSLRSHLGYSASEVKSVGFGIKELVDGGFNLLNDLKPLYTVHDFKAAGYGVWGLRTHLGYSAFEIKSAGFGINDLENGGFNPLRDLKPLFTIQEFKAAGYGAWTLKHNLDFTAKELLVIGYSKRELLGAGFTEKELE